jgi:hypothetical protein
MILKQAQQWPLRTGMNWDNKVGLQVAHGDNHSYLVDPPVKYNPEAAKHRAQFGRPDQHLLFTFPKGDPEHAWNFHSPHDSLQEAQTAAEIHNGGGTDG